MKSIFIYSPYWRNFGGGERYMLHLAVALSKLPGTEVGVISEFPDIMKEKLEKYFRLDLSKIQYRTLDRRRGSLSEFVRDIDIFVPLSNFRRIKGAARNLVQALQVPYPEITVSTIGRRIISGDIKEGLKDILRKRLLSYARTHARLTITNSQFVHDTLLRNFTLESFVLHPPIGDFLTNGIAKRKIILSVGRFFRGLYNDKRYDILTAAFRSISSRLQGWEYHIVGSAADDSTTNNLIRTLKEANAGFHVFFHVNESHESLVTLYNEATLMWHGAGFGVDEVRQPERTEHFGMSVVEGLSAKCIPIVVNRGGLKEIVSHGKDGFLWETTGELTDFTLRLADTSGESLKEIQENARKRYLDFSVGRFEKRASDIFLPMLG